MLILARALDLDPQCLGLVQEIQLVVGLQCTMQWNS
nr:MAG TPA: hypothetical protein [Caudoviricetes sp.]